MKQIKILSRKEAWQFSALNNIPSCIIISINSFNGNPLKFFDNHQIKAIVHFTFDDVECGNRAIQQDQADSIAKFVKIYIDSVECIVVHCDAGVSRSAGIGAAIAKWANGDDSEIFNNGRFCPNMSCFRFMLNALMVDMTDDEVDERFSKNFEIWKKANDL